MDRNTDCLAADPAGIDRASELLAAGQLVAFPTETVYGLGADARQGAAVARIFEAKGRPRFNPLIVHVADLATAERYGHFDHDALALANAFWPGPLTLVVPIRAEAGLSDLVTAGLGTVGLRVPRGDVAQTLLRRFAGPVAAPSANPSGKISPTRAEHVLDGLAGRIAAVLDGGAAEVGVESTIVGCYDHPRLLRPGGLPIEAIEAALGRSLAHAPPGGTPNAPGQLASHYAPDAALRVGAETAEAGEILIGFGPQASDAAFNLSPSGDLVEAAANLFEMLRQADVLGRPIAVSPIPEHGLGRAINDRLSRAAHPR
ncbi:L-threonylcarbamoyladenylate synthase [Tropicimonas sp. IMCC6043]|uniref:L-threonylcarbamoyladenylate synthase n=1 Tax=Tropicimonas sp. IMCC6043 TaxID=2510645 RepID=UPI00101DF216|nr:L-threonylcarbamoyladenylate synthase [Tropicimonas sp. IMCC6043]RYH10566.1 threonylcarbamoyl-AMP synthase [Tropicimonas sp. IMCC6043]